MSFNLVDNNNNFSFNIYNDFKNEDDNQVVANNSIIKNNNSSILSQQTSIHINAKTNLTSSSKKSSKKSTTKQRRTNPFIGPKSNSKNNFPEFPLSWTIPPPKDKSTTNTPSPSNVNPKNIFNFSKFDNQNNCSTPLQQQQPQQQNNNNTSMVMNTSCSYFSSTGSSFMQSPPSTPLIQPYQYQNGVSTATPASSNNYNFGRLEWSIDTLSTVLPVNITIDDNDDFDQDDLSADDSEFVSLQKWKQEDEIRSNQFFEKPSPFESSLICQKRKLTESFIDSDLDVSGISIIEECDNLVNQMTISSCGSKSTATQRSSGNSKHIVKRVPVNSSPIGAEINNSNQICTVLDDDQLFLTPIAPNRKLITSTPTSNHNSITSPFLIPSTPTSSSFNDFSISMTPTSNSHLLSNQTSTSNNNNNNKYKFKAPLPVIPLSLPEISPIKCKQPATDRYINSPPASPMKCWSTQYNIDD